ncbi:alpha/beta-hydrolase [Lojkania enalia]|uniref:Carboxypeptidase n=1 Tax=Lojkania enalia TaxID=147567 RepID=A0A9P4K8U9_9PLEO|nr:alpha/beta-hydrolase [Didymosphaeria enalia]
MVIVPTPTRFTRVTRTTLLTYQLQLLPLIFVSSFGLVLFASAEQFPPPVTYDTVLNSPINPNITISYRTPDPGTCTTAFSKQKQYSGYVHLPPLTLEPYQQNYSINTFFWFFEAREDPETAPLTIWLNGGPGSSSMIGLFREAGPCEVVQLQDGSYGTQASMWGWDRSSNLLFIDQPTQTGFSYDEVVNASVNIVNGAKSDPAPLSPGSAPWATLNGTFSSGDAVNTQNTSRIAASASWHFLQGFLAAFPQYNPGKHPNSTETEPAGVNLFAESYGGQYGPTFAEFFETQNARRLSGDLPRNSTLEIKLASLGIINGLVDELIQAPSFPMFAYNNTYGIRVIDQTTQLNALSDFNAPGGCKELINQCRDKMKTEDPLGEGDDPDTNEACFNALRSCNSLFIGLLDGSGRNVYDIRVHNPSSFPSYAYLEYLNTDSVLRSIGAIVNFTESSLDVWGQFAQTGDEIRGTQLESLANLLDLGVRIALIYGDADYICNWYGGEAISLALADLLPGYATAFPDAGYADIVANSSYVGGQVRQFGNLSFSRIYDAGHTVPSYQPETAFTVFTRIILGKGIGLGRDVDLSTFATEGSANSTHTNEVPDEPESTCWVRAATDTCNVDQYKAMKMGQGIVKNGVWYAEESDYVPPTSSVAAGKPGSLPTNGPTPTLQDGSPNTQTSSIPLTGVYTATGTPTPSSAASSLRFRVRAKRFQIFDNYNGGFEMPNLGAILPVAVVGCVLGL